MPLNFNPSGVLNYLVRKDSKEPKSDAALSCGHDGFAKQLKLYQVSDLNPFDPFQQRLDFQHLGDNPSPIPEVPDPDNTPNS